MLELGRCNEPMRLFFLAISVTPSSNSPDSVGPLVILDGEYGLVVKSIQLTEGDV